MRPPSVYPTVDMATYTDDGSGRAASTCDIEDMTGCTTPAMGAPDVPSYACSPMDAAIGYASLVDVVATPMLLTLTISAALVGSWHVCRRRIFFGASHRRVPCPPTLQGTWQSVHGKNSLRQKDEKNLDPP